VFGAGLVLGTIAGWPLRHRLLFGGVSAALAVHEFGGSLAAPGWGDIGDWWRRVVARGGDRATLRHRAARPLRLPRRPGAPHPRVRRAARGRHHRPTPDLTRPN